MSSTKKANAYASSPSRYDEDRSDSVTEVDEPAKSSSSSSSLLKYGAIGLVVAILFWFIIGNPFSSSPGYYDPAYMDPYYMGGGGYYPPQYGQYGYPYGMPPPTSSYSFTTGFAVLVVGLGILYYGKTLKDAAEIPVDDAVDEIDLDQEEEEEEQEEEEEDNQLEIEENGSVIDVVFEEGPLGFTLSNDPTHGVIISNVAAGGAAHSKGVQQGFRVLSIGDSEVRFDHKWEDVVDLIKQYPRPLTISLQKS